MTQSTQAWQAHAPNRHIITSDMPDFPDLLKHIDRPPKQLFVQGNVSLLRDPQIAIVGSRRMTPYGKQNAFQFAKDLASKGLTITSGLATGIDGEAHKGALAAPGQTIAVLGSGLDVVTPTHHQSLAQRIIAQGGVLVSELPLGTQPSKFTFPLRNRIITGLSLGVLIVEAALQSGSLVSARLANEQGREVFTIPGPIHSPMSRGCHHLLTQGAKLTQSSADILLELGIPLKTAIKETTPFQDDANKKTKALDKKDDKILRHIGYVSVSINTIVNATKLSPEVIANAMLILELNGYIQAVPGGYIRNAEPTNE